MGAVNDSIKANPVKAGDAKQWVYSWIASQDRQAAESHHHIVTAFSSNRSG